MKALASALALVLVGLFGVWLWFDAASDAVQDTAGVVVVSGGEPEAVSTAQGPGQDGVQGPAAGGDAQDADEQLEAADEIDQKVMAATVSSLRGIFDGVRLGGQTLVGEMRAAADEIAAEEKAAAEARKAEEQAAQQPAPQPAAPQPAPVQPLPVQPAPNPGGPPGPCWEWDDDEWEYECEDDWDDDDWDDFWEDYWEDYYDDDD